MKLVMSAIMLVWLYRLVRGVDDLCAGGLGCARSALDEVVVDNGIEAFLLQQQHIVEALAFEKGTFGKADCPIGYQEISFASQCEKASSSLGFVYSGGTSSSSQPRGCVAGSGFAYFNLVNESSASSDTYVLCETEAEASRAEPDPFVVTGKDVEGCPSGSAYQEIEYASQCKKASESLGLSYTGVKSSTTIPSGCVVYNQEDAYFNLIEGKGSSSLYYSAICETEKSAKHADADPFVRSGSDIEGCPAGSAYQEIEYASQCEEACESLGCTYKGGKSSTSIPSGCVVYNGNDAYFNLIEGNGAKSYYYSVICETEKSANHVDPDPFVMSGTDAEGCPSGSAYQEIESESQCKDASDNFGLTYKGVKSSTTIPSGCVVYNHADAYLNLIDGKGQASYYYSVICESGKGSNPKKKIEGHLRSKSMHDSCIHTKSHKETSACEASKNRWSYHTKHLTLGGEGGCLYLKNGKVKAAECEKNGKFQWEFESCDHEKGKCKGHIVYKNSKCLHFDEDDGTFSLKKCSDSDKKQQFVLKDE